MSNEYADQIDRDMARHKQMRNQAFTLRREAMEYFANNDYEKVKDTCKKFLELIRTLPKDSTDLFCGRTEIFCGDLVVFTASIFELLYVSYLNEDRVLEALACLQKINYIVQTYHCVEPKAAGKWEEYQVLLENINEVYSEVKGRLTKQITDAQQAGFIDEKLIINEEEVKARAPKVSLDNYNKIKNYNPYLFQCKLGNESSNSSSGCFIATAAYGSEYHTDIDTFREFRDKKMLATTLGKLLVNVYYKISPTIAKYVSSKPPIKLFVRHKLEHLARWMRTLE